MKLPRVRLSFFVSRPAFSDSLSTKQPPKRIKSPDQNFVCILGFSTSLTKPSTPISWGTSKPYPQLLVATRDIFKKVTQTLFPKKNFNNHPQILIFHNVVHIGE
jgi:hypothetical protein